MGKRDIRRPRTVPLRQRRHAYHDGAGERPAHVNLCPEPRRTRTQGPARHTSMIRVGSCVDPHMTPVGEAGNITSHSWNTASGASGLYTVRGLTRQRRLSGG